MTEMIKKAWITTPNRANRDHLAEVLKIVRRRGPPVIRAVPYPGNKNKKHWLALEGSHRIAAAKKLGLCVIIKVMRPHQRIRHDVNLGCLPQRTTVAKLVKELQEDKSWRVCHWMSTLVIPPS